MQFTLHSTHRTPHGVVRAQCTRCLLEVGEERTYSALANPTGVRVYGLNPLRAPQALPIYQLQVTRFQITGFELSNAIDALRTPPPPSCGNRRVLFYVNTVFRTSAPRLWPLYGVP